MKSVCYISIREKKVYLRDRIIYYNAVYFYFYYINKNKNKNQCFRDELRDTKDTFARRKN